jgi:hypothetical protein
LLSIFSHERLIGKTVPLRATTILGVGVAGLVMEIAVFIIPAITSRECLLSAAAMGGAFLPRLLADRADMLIGYWPTVFTEREVKVCVGGLFGRSPRNGGNLRGTSNKCD